MIKFFVGDDTFQKEKAIQESIQEFLGPLHEDPNARINLFSDQNYENQTLSEIVIQNCASASLFAEKKAVILWNFQAAKKDDAKDIGDYIQNPNPDTALFIEANKLDGRSELGKYANKNKLVQKFESMKEWNIPDWIVQTAQDEFQRRISKENARFLWQLIGNDLSMLYNELKKIDLFIGSNSDEITFETIQANTQELRDGNPFEFYNAFGHMKKEEMVKTFTRLLQTGVHPILITQGLFNHISNLLQTALYMQENKSLKDIATAVKMHPYLFEKINKMHFQSKKRTPKHYSRLLIFLAKIEHQLKTGSISTELEYEANMLPIF